MSTSVLTVPNFVTYNLAAGDGLVVARSGNISTSNNAAHAIVGAGANNITVQGLLSAFGTDADTVHFDAGNNVIVVESTGKLFAEAQGIDFAGGTNTLVNSGIIFGQLDGVFVGVGGTTSITNYGTIFGNNNGVVSNGSAVSLYNVGSVESVSDGVDTYSAGKTAIINTGSIIGHADNALDLSNTGDDAVVNNGYMQGPNGVALNGGNDYFDGRGGVQVGGVSGGAGNDTIYGGVQADLLKGDAGVDMLYGGGGADTINGGSEGDLIVGGAGADILTGGTGADLFVFQTGDGGDMIKDWNAGGAHDGIDLRQVFDEHGYAGYTAINDGVLAIYQNGSGSDIYAYGELMVRVENTVAAALVQDQSWLLVQ